MSSQYSVETTGATVEEAIRKGLEQLGVGPSQVIVEVIEEPSRGLFGLGSKVARVRLNLLAPPPQPPKPTETVVSQHEAPVQPVAEVSRQTERSGSDTEAPDDDYDDDFFDDDDFEEIRSPGKGKGRADVVDDQKGLAELEQKTTDAASSEQQKDKQQSRGYKRRKNDNRDGEKPERPTRSNKADERRDDSEDERRSRGRGGNRRGKRRRERGVREESTVITPPIEFQEGMPDYEIGEMVLVELLDLMDLPATLNTTQASSTDVEETPPYILNILGDSNDVDPLIGSKGDTLAALQYLVRLIVSKQTEARANIIVDVDDYRVKRSDKIAKLANRVADQAVETRRTMKLEPMPPHERRIIHMALRKRDDVKTESTGQGDARRVTIIPNSD